MALRTVLSNRTSRGTSGPRCRRARPSIRQEQGTTAARCPDDPVPGCSSLAWYPFPSSVSTSRSSSPLSARSFYSSVSVAECHLRPAHAKPRYMGSAESSGSDSRRPSRQWRCAIDDRRSHAAVRSVRRHWAGRLNCRYLSLMTAGSLMLSMIGVATAVRRASSTGSVASMQITSVWGSEAVPTVAR